MKKNLLIISSLLLLAGCALFGSGAQAPGKFEESLFATTNVPMVTVHNFTNIVTVTNIVPQVKEQVVTVTRTNEIGMVVPQYLTNTVTVLQTNVVEEKKVVPAGTTVMVPQLIGRTATGDGVIGTATGIAGLWGLGPIVGLVLSGGFNWWQRARNQALAAAYTGATESANAANQAGAVLVQGTETLLEVLNKTPQGQAVLPSIKNFLRTHQLETDTAEMIAQFIDAHVDNEAARDAAEALLKGVNSLKA